MRFAKYVAVAALVGSLTFGCSKPAPKTTDNDQNSPNNAQPSEPAKPVVPDDLKGEGYSYMGLENTDLMTYETTFNTPAPQEGTQQYELKEVKDGKAIYDFKRSGALSLLGLDTRELSAEGIKTTNSSMGVLKSDSLEMPADIHVGSTWNADISMENLSNGTKSITSSAVNKATKIETIEVPAGKFECIRIESTIQATVEGSPAPEKNGKSTTKFVSWYSKGVGLIKLTGHTKEASGSESDILLELKSRTP